MSSPDESIQAINVLIRTFLTQKGIDDLLAYVCVLVQKEHSNKTPTAIEPSHKSQNKCSYIPETETKTPETKPPEPETPETKTRTVTRSRKHQGIIVTVFGKTFISQKQAARAYNLQTANI